MFYSLFDSKLYHQWIDNWHFLNALVNWLSSFAAEQRENDVGNKTCFPQAINILLLETISVDCKADRWREQPESHQHEIRVLFFLMQY